MLLGPCVYDVFGLLCCVMAVCVHVLCVFCAAACMMCQLFVFMKSTDPKSVPFVVFHVESTYVCVPPHGP